MKNCNDKDEYYKRKRKEMKGTKNMLEEIQKQNQPNDRIHNKLQLICFS